jgi:hypothetical protein
MIEMNTDAAWILANAEKEDNGIVSVGGLVCTLAQTEGESIGPLAERKYDADEGATNGPALDGRGSPRRGDLDTLIRPHSGGA